MTQCTISGCRNLEGKCADCGRVASTATFGLEHNGLLSISENSAGRIEYLPNPYEWISVKDRLPEHGTLCIVIVRYNNCPKKETCPWIEIKKFSKHKKWGYIKKNVEFWSAIPVIPKGIINGRYL